MAPDSNAGEGDYDVTTQTQQPSTPAPTTKPAPGAGGVPSAGAPAADRTSSSAVRSWSDFLGDPKTRAALLQFGVQMLQPVGPGQSLMGAVGEAVGAGGAAADRYQASQNELRQKAYELQTQRQTAESEAALRQAQGEYYRSTGAARLGMVDVRKMAPEGRASVALLARITALEKATSPQAVELIDPNDTEALRQLALDRQELANLKEYEPQLLKSEELQLSKQNAAAGGGGAAPAEPATSATSSTNLAGVPADKVLSQATEYITANKGQKAAVIDMIHKQRPEIDTKPLEGL